MIMINELMKMDEFLKNKSNSLITCLQKLRFTKHISKAN